MDQQQAQQGVNQEERKKRLEVWLQKKMPKATDIAIYNFVRAGGGFSNENYFFELRWKEDGKEKLEQLVGRWAPEHPMLPYSDLEQQFKVMKCLEKGGFMTPKAYWFEGDTKVLGTPFVIMGKVDGISPPEYPPTHHGTGFMYEEKSFQKRAEWWYMAVEAMARMHSLDWKKLGLTFLEGSKGGKEATNLYITYWEKMLDWAEPGFGPLPVERAAFDWAKKNIPDPKHLSLHWGDARIGNLIYRKDLSGIAAMVDWDLARICPPEIDLIYFFYIDNCLADNFHVPRLEGLPDLEETVKYYEKITHRKVEDFFYYQVLAALDAAVVAVMGAKILGYMPGMDRNIVAQMAKDNWGKRKLIELLNLKNA